MPGNVYCGGAGGIWVIDSAGKKLGRIVHGAPNHFRSRNRKNCARKALCSPIGGGMGAALNAAQAMNAYTISDRGTWLSFEPFATASFRNRRTSAVDESHPQTV